MSATEYYSHIRSHNYTSDLPVDHLAGLDVIVEQTISLVSVFHSVYAVAGEVQNVTNCGLQRRLGLLVVAAVGDTVGRTETRHRESCVILLSS